MLFKDKTRETLLEVYRDRGYNFSVSLASKIIGSEELKKADPRVKTRNTVAGEVCETVLEIAILEFMNLNQKLTEKWFYAKGLVLKDLDTADTEFLTEVDFILFTPQVIYLFECKGYIGDKRITDRGTIVRAGKKKFDVYNQHVNHLNVFKKNFDSFRKQEYEECTSYQMAAFSFSPGLLEDIRSNEWKKELPFLEISDMSNFLSSKCRGEEVWMIEYCKKAVELIQKDREFFVSKHLSYVTSLHHSKKPNLGSWKC
jgi:hypothetical protein